VRTYKEKLYQLKNGETVTIKEIVEASGLCRKSAYSRIHRASSRKAALTPKTKEGKGGKPNKGGSGYQRLYGELPEELHKLLFGSWQKGV